MIKPRVSRAYFGASVVTCPSCWPSSSCFCCGCVCVFLLPGVNIFFHLPRPLANWPSSSCCLLWLCVCCFCCWPNNISLSSLCIFFFNFFRMDPKKSEYNLPNTKFLGWYSSYIALPCCQRYPHRHHCPSHWHYCRPPVICCGWKVHPNTAAPGLFPGKQAGFLILFPGKQAVVGIIEKSSCVRWTLISYFQGNRL